MTIALVIVGILVALVALVLIIAATKPDRYSVQRQATINAPPEKIFPLINDFHRWGGWSPWEKLDPNMQRTHSGAAEGKGAAYAWEGNKKVGQGRMEILESVPPARVVIKLDFLKPFEAHNTTEFTLAPQGGATLVTWTMHGSQPFMFKVMTLFMSIDKMIGKDFEAGLASMKAIAEK